MKKEKITYYHDELNDEFSTAVIKPIPIDENYKYDRDNLLGRFAHLFWYWIVAHPLAVIYLKLKFRHKIVNKKVFKGMKKTGFFLYGNHTNASADALIPSFVVYPKTAYVIVHANNVSMPFLGKITPSLGALPLPDDMKATRNFMAIINKRIEQNRCVMIYPEAHIWPYYTKIRPFVDTSFLYPIKQKVPTYCFTNTYQKRRFSKKPKMVTYVDGPFYSDESLSTREQRMQLRNMVYDKMVERSKNSNIEVIKYVKAEEKE